MILYPENGWPNKKGNGEKTGGKRTTVIPDKVVNTTPKSGSGNNTTKK
jgi:hypothetical protein